MKLNCDCVRSVMTYLERQPIYILNETSDVVREEIDLDEICSALPDYQKNDIFYTIILLDEAGFLDVSTLWADGQVYECHVNDITYKGHEFLAKIKDDTVWKKTLSLAETVGNFSLKMIAEIAQGVATAHFKQLLGIN